MIEFISTLAALLAMAPAQLAPEMMDKERHCGEACVLRQTYLRSDRTELLNKFPGFEKIDPRSAYKAYVACTVGQFQLIHVMQSDTDAQIDTKFQNSFDRCSKSRVKGDSSFLPKVVGVDATPEERKAVLDARRGQLIVSSLLEQGAHAKQDNQVARIERYMEDLVKPESANS